MDKGSVPAFSLYQNVTDTDITGSGSDPVELEDATLGEARVMECFNTTGSAVRVYLGPNTNLQLLCIVPGIASGIGKTDRGPVTISAGSRISVRAVGTAAITAGEFIINFWK